MRLEIHLQREIARLHFYDEKSSNRTIADAVGVEAVDPHVWELVQGPLGEALSAPDGLRRGDLGAVARLTDALMMSGLAMQVHRTSRPASGVGHYFSHQWEMEGYGRDWDPPLSSMSVTPATLGAEAARMLLRRIGEPDSPIRSIILRPRLMLRGSTAAPPAG